MEEEGRRPTIDELGLTAAAGDEAKTLGPREFLFAWFQLFRTAQIHAIDNRAVRRPVENFIEVSKQMLEREGSVSFQAKDGTLFINSMKMKLSSEEYYEVAGPIFEFCQQRGMGGFVLEGELDSEAVLLLLRIFVYELEPENAFGKIQSALQAAQLPLRINKPLGVRRGGASAEVVLERRAYTFLTYSKLMVLYRTLQAERGNVAKRNFAVKKIGRTVQQLVDICLEDDHTFLGVSAVKSAENYGAQHAANMAVLSISLGEKLGLSKVDLADLGLAAIFCDVGLLDVAAELLDKAGPLTEEERQQIERHTQSGVEFLFGEKFYTKSVLRRIVVAAAHHRWVNGDGYPRVARRVDLYSRIVAIADCYDAMTSERPWRRALLPDEALARMVAEAGKKFDPVLLKIFINSLGLYPAGTLVRLSTGELAVVVYGGGEGERATRPVVALLDAAGEPGETLDLLEKGPAGEYVRGIVATEDPARYGLQSSGLVARSPVA